MSLRWTTRAEEDWIDGSVDGWIDGPSRLAAVPMIQRSITPLLQPRAEPPAGAAPQEFFTKEIRPDASGHGGAPILDF